MTSKPMAASKASDQMGQVEVTTQPLHAVAEEMSCDECYVRKKKNNKMTSSGIATS